MPEITIEISEPHIMMLEELKGQHGAEVVEGDIQDVIERAIEESYRQL